MDIFLLMIQGPVTNPDLEVTHAMQRVLPDSITLSILGLFYI